MGSEENEPLVPVAFCPECNEKVPVYVATFDFGGEELQAVVCVMHELVINGGRDIEVEYFTIDEIAGVTNYEAEVKDE